MVSYPDLHERDPRNSRLPFNNSSSSSTQRTPSIASSSRASWSTVRRYRHGRSHHGGSGGGAAYRNEFPIFGVTGDVEIILKSQDGRREQKYVLHRLYLSQNSGFFEANIGEERLQNGDSSRRNDGNDDFQRSRKWRFELEWKGGQDDTPILVQRPVSSSSSSFGASSSSSRPPPLRPKPPAPSTGFFRSMINSSALRVPSVSDDPSDEIFRSYDNLFRIFYNYSPTLDTENIANAYVECKSLLKLADIYDSLDIVGPRIDHHLIRFQGRLWKHIAKYPPSYLKLGFVARSKDIFREALIHVVGQWPAGERQLRGELPQNVMELIEDKVDELEETKARVESKLWRLTLTTSRGERVNPQNDWLAWLVMSFWRQWFAENTTPAPVGILKDTSASLSRESRSSSLSRSRASSSSRANNSALVPLNSNGRSAPPPSQPRPSQHINTGRVFRLIGLAGSAYLGHDEVKRFLRQAGPDVYNRDNVRRAERRMEELKNLARAVVQPLMRNFLELDMRDAGLGYLTCTRIDQRDWPWDED